MAQFPSFYSPQKVGTFYKPNKNEVAEAAELAGLPPATRDTRPNALLLVDFQIDFCHPDGSLSVPGAVDDLRRSIEFLYRHAENIRTLIISLDTHLPHQIFYPTWWEDPQTHKHPKPYTPITSADLRAGKWQSLQDPVWSSDYVSKLEAQAKKPLFIWPFHTMLGDVGQALDPALYEAVLWHSVARKTQPVFVQKGSIPQTEHYSPFEAEVKVPNHPEGGLQVRYFNTMEKHERTFIAGEAKSHCVLEAGASLMRHFASRPDVIERFTFLSDCMSSVVAPGVDFEGMANAQIADWQKQGLRVTKSTDVRFPTS